MTTTETKSPPGLFSSHASGLLIALAIGTGVIALGTLFVELMTDRSLAKLLPFGVDFISAPLGAATVVLAALIARTDRLWSAAVFALGAAYWIAFLIGS
ncbi:MAG: hypothetical protein ACOCV2_07625 [Persicimonas sp.]